MQAEHDAVWRYELLRWLQRDNEELAVRHSPMTRRGKQVTLTL